MQSSTLSHVQEHTCTVQSIVQEAKLTQVLTTLLVETPRLLHRAYKHFIARCLHLSLTRILKAVVISRPHPPSLNEKPITDVSVQSQCRGSFVRNLPPHLTSALYVLLSQIRFNLFSLSLWL